jgi:hypothetical protein
VVRPLEQEAPVLFDVSLPWLTGVLALTFLVSLALLRIAWGVFFNRSADFAEEL